MHGDGRYAAHTDTNGIHLDSHGLGRLGGGERRYLSGVVHAVGEQNDDLGFCIRGSQPIDAGGDGRTDGGAVLAGERGVDALEILLQPVMVESERAHQVRGGGEGNQADAVVGALLDEARDHGFDHLNAVDAPVVHQKIERLHGAGDIQPEHDVDAIGGDFCAAVGPLWAREANDHEGAGQQGQQPQPTADAGAAAARHFAGKTHIRKFAGRDRSAPSTKQHYHGQKREQPQPFRLKEANHVPIGWPVGAVFVGTAAAGFDVSITKRRALWYSDSMICCDKVTPANFATSQR